MEEEIKEIFNYFIKYANIEDSIKIGKLEDYITNLQEELEELREDNYAYHQLMKIQNEREYRSKFLKEFQEEFGKNVFPDYDEIYKRYDKLKEENKQLKKENSNLLNTNYWLNSRIDNAIEFVNEFIQEDYYEKLDEYITHFTWNTTKEDLLNKLKGDNK